MIKVIQITSLALSMFFFGSVFAIVFAHQKTQTLC